ncbi:MAG: SPOR domain-containing protein [Sphingosinicella sp.]|nr:SPOR domain-containing protein [Sphingosinicella sp.]
MTLSGSTLFPRLAALAAILVASPAAALQAPYPIARPGVAPYEESASNALARHVRSLAASPRSLPALLGAANAALELGDTHAALTFFARAEEVAPRDGRVKAGMGSAFVQTEQPQAALKFFADAMMMGAPIHAVAKDRGLAHDMLGDQRGAQADYALVLALGSDPETERRLALSKAISGDREGALALLEPQVRRHETAGWRTRAFVLALTGDTKEAVTAAAAVMPQQQVGAMEPFLALLPRLTPAEQVMAVHFGRFPQNAASRPGAQYAAVAPATPRKPGARAAADSRGERRTGRPSRSKGRSEFPSSRDRGSDEAARSSSATQTRSAPTQQENRPAPTPSASVAPLLTAPPQIRPRPVETAQVQDSTGIAPRQTQIAPIQTAETQTIASQPVQKQQQEASLVPASPPSSTIALAELAPSQVASDLASPVAMTNPPAPASRDEIDFADIAAEISAMQVNEAATPAQEMRSPAPVDAKAKTVAKPKPVPAKKTEPAKPREPSRIWVQLAAAQDKNAFPGEYRRLKTKAGKLLSDKTAWTAPLRATNRLLVGPFKTDKEARDLVNELSKLKISSYAWTSEAGQTIEKLPAR